MPCRLPVEVSGSPPSVGWLDFPAGKFASDPTSTVAMSKYGYVAWDSALGQWLPTRPGMISPDGTRYIPEDAPNQIVDSHTGAVLVTFPSGNYNWVIGWTSAGIYETHSGKDFLPGLWRIDPSSGTVTNLTPTAEVIWEIVDNDAVWGFEWSPTNVRIIDRLDLATASIKHVYTAPTVNDIPDAVAFVGSGVLVLSGDESGVASTYVLGQDGSTSPIALPSQMLAPGESIRTVQDGPATLFYGQLTGGLPGAPPAHDWWAAYDPSYGMQVLFESPQPQGDLLFLLGDCVPT